MEALFGGLFVRTRAALGVTSFGMQVVNLPADHEAYPEHKHDGDGQEEVYTVLSGSAQLQADGQSGTSRQACSRVLERIRAARS